MTRDQVEDKKECRRCRGWMEYWYTGYYECEKCGYKEYTSSINKRRRPYDK